MTLTLELWQVITLVLAIISGYWTLGKIIASQVGGNINQKFKVIDEKFKTLAEAEERTSNRVAQLERDLMALIAELPTRFVMRDDYVRGQSLIEAKLDGLFNRGEAMKNDLINKLEAIWKGKP